MSEVSQVQWFPGHMAKTRRLMAANMKLVDAVVEMTDARIPYSSHNPEIGRLTQRKPRLVILNKSDAADPNVTDMWLDWFSKKNMCALALDCKSGKNINKFYVKLRELLADDIEKWNEKGMKGRPGVTRGKQWVRLDEGFELLDMPGVLWPKFEDKLVGERLAFTGAVKDQIMDTEYLACRLLEYLKENYPELVVERYGIDLSGIEEPDDEMMGCTVGYELLERVGKKRGFLVRGGEINTEIAAATVLDEYRAGKIGRLTLEKPKGY